MKNFFLKLKSGISTLWVTLISLNMGRAESWYWVPEPEYYLVKTPVESPQTTVNLIQRILPVITFIVWIVSLIMILKTKDKEKKEKRIKISIIVMLILIILTIASFVIVRLLNK